MTDLPLYPLRFEPICQYRVWSGRRLAELLPAPLPGDGPIGEAWPQFETQVLPRLPHDGRLNRLSILPTCGTKFFQYDGAWKKLYSEDFTDAEAKSISEEAKRVREAVTACLTPAVKTS